MIDIEFEMFDIVATAVRAAYPDAFVVGEYVATVPRFPAVSIVEMDNSTVRRTQSSANMENTVEVMYEVNVYSNKVMGKKAECKAVLALIDEQFLRLGFNRVSVLPTQNLNDATIYRMTARYRAEVDRDKRIYRGVM